MQKRLSEIDNERMISAMPPVIVGGSLVIPKGLLLVLMHKAEPDTFSQGDRQAIEYAGMKAVMDIERKLGFIPSDVSGKKCGYDVESEVPKELRGGDGTCLRFIEVNEEARIWNKVLSKCCQNAFFAKKLRFVSAQEKEKGAVKKVPETVKACGRVSVGL